MQRELVRSSILIVALLTVCGAVFAHHGNAAFDEQKVVVLKNATVTQFFWANPHVLTFFDVRDDQGQVVHWTVETSSPQGLKTSGWTRNSMKPGDVITVYAYQSKNGDPVGTLQKIVLADGTTLSARGGKGPTDAGATPKE